MKNNFKILIVDDEEHLLLIYKKLLLTAGYQVFTAQNGTEAIEMAKKHRPQLVLLDVILPDISGIEVLKTLKKQPETQHCFVVLISSKLISSEDRSLGLETGADDYLLKPIQNRELVARVDSFIRHKTAIDKLIKSEEHFRVTLDSIGDAVIATDTEGRITRMNPVAESLTGWQLADIQGKPLQDVFHIVNAITGEEAENPVNEVLKTGGLVGLANHTKLISKNGKEFQISDSAAPIKNDNGNVIGVVLVFRDVTEEYHVRQQLKENEERFRVIVEGAPDPIFIQSEMKFAYLNPAACKLFGIESADALLGKPVMERFHPDYNEKIKERIHNLNEGKESVRELLELRFLRIDGSEVWVETTGEPIFYKGKNGALVFVRDITDRKNAEEELAHSEKLMRYVIENTKSGVAVHDKDLKYIYVSQRYLEQYKVKEEDIIGRHHYDVFPDLPQKWRDVHQRVLKGEVLDADRDSYYRDDGTLEWTRWQCRPWYNSTGDIGGLIVYTEVITDQIKVEQELKETIEELQKARKASLNLIEDLKEEIEKRTRSENKLKESEERFRLVMENSLDAILITNPDGSILNANKAACELFQMAEEEMRRVGRKGIVNPNDPNLSKLMEERKKKGYTSGELTFFRKDGTLFPGDISSSVFINSQGELRTSMIIRDITERKQVEKKLRNSDRIFEHSVDMMSVSGFDGYFKILNPAWEKTLGWSIDELLSKPWNDFVHPDDLEATDNIKAEIVDGREAYRFENRYRCKDGSYRWLSWNSFPYPEENTMFAVVRDITKDKQDEAILRESEERFSIAFKASPAPLVISEIETGLFIDVNDRWIKMLGYSREEQIGRTSKEVGIWLNPSERDRIIEILQKNGSFKNEYIEFNTKSGETILALWSAETIRHSGKNLMLSMIHDITARVKAERELRILKESLEMEVEEKTQELRLRIAELERFQNATIEREFRIKELRDEIEILKGAKS